MTTVAVKVLKSIDDILSFRSQADADKISVGIIRVSMIRSVNRGTKDTYRFRFFFGATSDNRKISPTSEKEESEATDRRFLFARPNKRSTIRKFRERSTGKNPAG